MVQNHQLLYQRVPFRLGGGSSNDSMTRGGRLALVEADAAGRAGLSAALGG